MKSPNFLRIAALWLALFLAGVAYASDTLHGRVVAVTDGDTLTVLDETKQQHKIRVLAIDAPERNQAFASRSKDNLARLAFNRQSSVQVIKADRYGRRVGIVVVDGGVDVGLEQVRAGMAWHFKAYERDQAVGSRAVYAAAEFEARAAKRGLWADPAPVPPWDWRRRHKHAAD